MSKEVNEERTPRTVEDVKEMLTKHSNGEIQRTIQNCITILQNDHVLADAIRLNLLSERIDIVKPVGWLRSGKTLNDTDMKYILRRMEKYGIFSEKKIESAIRIVANENRYHPIRDYLNSLKWDGTERIPHVLHHFLGAAEDEYTCEAMKIFLLGAIKRVFQPGCKFETMLCLVGGQGCGSPVATSKCCKHFEAPTEPTGETSSLQGSRVKPLPSDMMLCVISYWVLSGAPQAADSAAKLLRTHPTKMLKWRDVYLKLTRHNGRAGKHGTYNPKHNDRNFDLTNSEHIDPERAKGNIYWDCFHGFRSTIVPQDPDDLATTFSDVERQFYETHYTAFIENQNERNAKIRHTERNRSIPDLLSSRKTCPEETIYQLGTLDEHASAEDLLNIVTEFIEEFKTKFGEHVHVLDWALHLDESTPHIHERHVFDCENKYGEVAPQQEKALEALGFDLPDPDKPLSRRNNRKITFDAACRKMLFEIAKRYGLDLEEEAEYGNRKYLEKQDFILAKQRVQLAAQQSKLDELTLKVSDMETLLEDVSAAAYDKAVEVVTDVVRTETRKEDMRMIEDTKRWVLSPERKAPQATREYTAKHLDTVLDKFLKTMQTTAARLQEKLLKPEVRQKGKEQVKEKARDSVLQLLSRLQAEQAQNKPAAQPRTQEEHSEI